MRTGGKDFHLRKRRARGRAREGEREREREREGERERDPKSRISWKEAVFVPSRVHFTTYRRFIFSLRKNDVLLDRARSLLRQDDPFFQLRVEKMRYRLGRRI